MKPLPLPLRVAAGLAVSTAERARELPKQIVGLPVTVISQVLQFSMQVQQRVTELAIKGDDALSMLRPVEDTPSWATFDDAEPDLSSATSSFDNVTPLSVTEAPTSPAGTNGHRRKFPDIAEESAGDPRAAEKRALAKEHEHGGFDSSGEDPAGLPNYDDLTLPQLRARLRRFSLEQLEELLTYERDHADRASFVGMLSRRIGNVNKAAQDDGDGSTGR